MDLFTVLKYLIEDENVNVNAKANDGTTVLHYATKTSTPEIVRYLVDKMDSGDHNIFYF